MSKTVFINSKIYVERGNFQQALYQEDGIIKTVGTNEEVLAVAAADAEKIDCEGKVMLPGINDSHMHILNTGKTMLVPNLSLCHSVDEIVDACKKYLESHPSCKGLACQGWIEQTFYEGQQRLPNKHDLDKISTEIPIVTTRGCEHACCANSKLLELMGIDKEHNVWKEGGVIDVDENGEPTGMLREDACRTSWGFVPAMPIEEQQDAIVIAMEYAAKNGVTSVQSNELGSFLAGWKENYYVVRGVYEKGRALVRYTAQTTYPTIEDALEYINGPHFKECSFDDWFKLGPLKLVRDGALGARTAMMRHEYFDDPGNYGVDCIGQDYYVKMIQLAAEHDIQLVTHCIGDDCIEKCVDAYASVNRPDLRFGVVHNQITDIPLLQKIKDSGCVVSYQPIFLDDDMWSVESRCGKETTSTSYAFKTAIELGIPCGYGTDSPVCDINPFKGIYCAVTRKDLKGRPEGGFYPQECVDVETAVDCYTTGSAYFEFREDVKGRLKPGFYADLCVIDQDIFTCEPDAIKDTTVSMTMCGGKFTYRK